VLNRAGGEPSIDEEDRRFLRDFFHDDIREVEALPGGDCSDRLS